MRTREPERFRDLLAVTLTLTIDGTAHTIAGGSVHELALDLHSYGFSGSLAFVVQDDQAHFDAQGRGVREATQLALLHVEYGLA